MVEINQKKLKENKMKIIINPIAPYYGACLKIPAGKYEVSLAFDSSLQKEEKTLTRMDACVFLMGGNVPIEEAYISSFEDLKNLVKKYENI